VNLLKKLGFKIGCGWIFLNGKKEIITREIPS
jgi:hypothetical protein